ncbi:NAD(P)/FAD-dependent oxidoreductase [Neptunomonas japonica]|uniref:FAD-dependent oxidoreductase n=1 Tax=Neptunomonas japonica JAMM 1380 TaxID=1441457 RepID=A0A7R6PVD5_9GAMM|nr:FAD-dependent oxidoreductase [Neptunomonas japonica]BBB30283.1 FAD-dependent oxidoreductase [Neptunomonas japonica JAMM 1380]
MDKSNKHVAIIGAGIAGSTLANKLLSAGYEVSIYEKSRGTGGRLASCRLGDNSADLGAPLLSPASDTFRQWLTQHPNVSVWRPNTHCFNGKHCKSQTHFIAMPRQSSLTRELIQGANLYTSIRVGYLWPERSEEPYEEKQNKVLLRDEHGKALGHYDAAIVATPAKQAAPLLEALPRFERHTETATPTTSWVLVIQVSSPLPITVELIQGQHPLLLRCIKDSAKPGRISKDNSTTWAIEATPEWSALNRESDPKHVAEQLRKAFFPVLNRDFNTQPVITAERVHRWLYSRHITQHFEHHVDSGYLWDGDSMIGACGDWLESGDIEGAWLSANKLAEQIILQLERL